MNKNTMSDAMEKMGVSIARHYNWDGAKILETFAAALEDANFHAEAAQARQMLDDVLATGYAA